MAFLHGRLTSVWFNEHSLTPYLNSAGLSATGDTADTTVFGNTWKTAVAGQGSATASFGGFHDVDLTELDQGALGQDSGVLTYCPGGGAVIGDVARLALVIETSLSTSSPVGGAVAITWDALSQSSVGFGAVLHPLGEDTNTTTGATKDDAAASATGWMAHLHVTLVDGGAWVVKLQDSADGSSWADVTGGAFASLSAVGSERIVSAAATTALRRYIRYAATRTGGTAGDGITFALAVARTR